MPQRLLMLRDKNIHYSYTNAQSKRATNDVDRFRQRL